MASTTDRRARILEIIDRQKVRSQQELRRALARIGIRVSQASISRDVSALGLDRSEGHYSAKGSQPIGAPEIAPDVGHQVLEVRSASSFLIVLTGEGKAQATAVELDRLRLPGVVGTVAGSDTFIVALEGPQAARRLRRALRAAMRRRS